MTDAELARVLAHNARRVSGPRFGRRHLWFAVVSSLVAAVLVVGISGFAVLHAEGRVHELRAVTQHQRDRLHEIDAETSRLDGQLRRIQRQNADIIRLFGHVKAAAPKASGGRTQSYAPTNGFAVVSARIERLRRASTVVARDDDRLRRLALRILSVRRLEDVARSRVLAAIPSVNPGGDRVGIRSPYGWRVDPWPEFHAGVDLDLDYGDPVRAAADGTVVASGFDGGGYGIKIDVDHGNGYHTWYCHLSRADVAVGAHVRKGERIALVGSTGESTGPHLHYQIMLDGRAIDPTPYLAGIPVHVLASLK